jgi:hypothetical protein
MIKMFIALLFLSSHVLANDYIVSCKPWSDNPNNFSLDGEIEITGGSYIDAWISLKVLKNGQEIGSTNKTFSFGLFSIDQLDGKRVTLFELKPAGGQTYKYDFLNLAANHPYPTGNSYLIYNGEEFQAECITTNKGPL